MQNFIIGLLFLLLGSSELNGKRFIPAYIYLSCGLIHIIFSLIYVFHGNSS
jgi:hypothetical protein